jgi:hypothetical protein
MFFWYALDHRFHTVIILSKTLMILCCFYLHNLGHKLKKLWIFRKADHLMKLSSNSFQLTFSFLLCDNQ